VLPFRHLPSFSSTLRVPFLCSLTFSSLSFCSAPKGRLRAPQPAAGRAGARVCRQEFLELLRGAMFPCTSHALPVPPWSSVFVAAEAIETGGARPMPSRLARVAHLRLHPCRHYLAYACSPVVSRCLCFPHALVPSSCLLSSLMLTSLSYSILANPTYVEHHSLQSDSTSGFRCSPAIGGPARSKFLSYHGLHLFRCRPGPGSATRPCES